MSNELTKKQEELVKIITEDGITKAISPFVKEIELFETFVSGTSYLDDSTVLAKLKEDDKLILRRETDNRFDENAIMVLTESKEKIGYIPQKDNRFLVKLLDYGKLLTGKVKSITYKNTFPLIRILICLVDY